MPKYRVYKQQLLTQLSADQVFPITPPPVFSTHTSHIKIMQSGFMDDKNTWHQAPKNIKEAVRINGIWYWACGIRNRHSGKIMISKALLFPGS